MKWYFDFNEFITLDDNEFGEQTFLPTPDITDKIVKNFMIPLQFIRLEINQPVIIRSCYRTKAWEHRKGRSGSSQHCFKGEGACDVALRHKATKKDYMRLFTSLKMGDNFQRIAYYPEQRFFHIDRKSDERQYFIAEPKWRYVSYDEMVSSIE